MTSPERNIIVQLQAQLADHLRTGSPACCLTQAFVQDAVDRGCGVEEKLWAEWALETIFLRFQLEYAACPWRIFSVLGAAGPDAPVRFQQHLAAQDCLRIPTCCQDQPLLLLVASRLTVSVEGD